jgi:hypothetical protein
MSRLFLPALVILSTGSVFAAPVNGSHPFETAAECDDEMGSLSLSMDVYGSYGSAVSIRRDATFNPANDAPDRGAQGTVYESKPFLCRTQGRRSTGIWLEQDPLAAAAVTDGQPNRMTSQYTVDGVTVDLLATLDCTILTQCWTFTNSTGDRLDTLAITPYIDGDLYFEGNFNNDYAGASVGIPQSVYEFDAGDDVNEPTTMLALYGQDPNDQFLTGWEVSEFSESRERIGNTRNGCAPLRNGITDENGGNTDDDADRLTDQGYDVTLALRFDAGPLEDGHMSPAICYSTRWGYQRPCSDEDMDGICVPEDNCPTVPNPDQADSDGDGLGDACDNCPNVHNIAQADADMDGIGDECDPQTCVDGQPEECNGLDDDCDERIDEDAAENGTACDSGEPGHCGPGQNQCVDGALVCFPVGVPADEVCDGSDNDCDGAIDEDIVLNEDCATGLPGICASGRLTCLEGIVACESTELGDDEVCDGLDNDCDGLIDEQLRNQCGLCGSLPMDICDGIDADCDGNIDENAMCPDGHRCVEGECASPCVSNECFGGEICVRGVCVDPCTEVVCEAGLQCEAGVCFDPCADVQCPDEHICHAGQCVENDCEIVGCPADQQCRRGVCEPDPCAEVACPSGEFCREGQCISSCALISCPLHQDCIDGVCLPNGCAALECEINQMCINDMCVDDACVDVMCPDDGQCVDGQCQPTPCDGIECPPGQTCVVRQGTAQCALEALDGVPPGSMPGRDGGVAEGSDMMAVGQDANAVAFVESDALLPPPRSADAGAGSGPGEQNEGTSGCTCRTGQGNPQMHWWLLIGVFGLRRRLFPRH